MLILDSIESLCRQFYAYERRNDAISNQVPKAFLRSPIEGDKLLNLKHFLSSSYLFVYLFENENFLIETHNGLYSTKYNKILNYELCVNQSIISYGTFSLMLGEDISKISKELRELTHPV